MRKFAIKLFRFSLIPIFTIVLIEFNIHLYKENFLSESRIESLFQNDAAQYEWINKLDSDRIIVLAGSSSVKYGLSCSELGKLSNNEYQFVNIALDARDPIVTYFILKQLDLEKVSAIYFGLDPWIYSKRYYKHRDKYLYLDFSFIESLKFSIEHDNGVFIKRYKSLFSNLNKNSSTKIKKNLIVPNDFGSVQLDKNPVNFNEKVESWFQIDDYGWSELQFHYLEKIVRYCAMKNVELNFFIPPKREDFTIGYMNGCQNIHKEYISKMQQSSTKIGVFGTFKQLAQIGDSIYFVDGIHLNKTGQKKYSELFYTMMNDKHQLFSKDYNWFQ